ncbi:MAG: hypothetical protein ACHQJ6_04450 [Candidatus Berkiellales bacterium]
MKDWQNAVTAKNYKLAEKLMDSSEFDANSPLPVQSRDSIDQDTPSRLLNKYSHPSSGSQNEIDPLKNKLFHHPNFVADYQFFQSNLNFNDVYKLMQSGVSMPWATSVLTARTTGNRFSIDGKVTFPLFNYGNFHTFTLHDFKNNKTAETPKAFTLAGNQHALGHLSLAHSFRHFIDEANVTTVQNEKIKKAFAYTLRALDQEADLNFKKWIRTFNYTKVLFDSALSNDFPILIRSGWDKHGIYFVKNKDMLYLCNTGDGSDGKHGIIVYKIGNLAKFDESLVKDLDTKISKEFILEKLPMLLDLQVLIKIPEPEQETGNCVWKSEQVAIKALLHANLMNQGFDIKKALDVANPLYSDFVKYDLNSAVENMVFNKEDLVETAFYDTLMLEVLKADVKFENPGFVQRSACILSELQNSQALQDYLAPEKYDHMLNTWLPDLANVIIKTVGCIVHSTDEDDTSCSATLDKFKFQSKIDSILDKKDLFNDNPCDLTGNAELIDHHAKNYPILTARMSLPPSESHLLVDATVPHHEVLP